MALPPGISRFELLITVLVGGAVAIFVAPGLGAVIWAIGLLIAIGEARYEARLGKRFETVEKLAEVFDLSKSCEVDELRNLLATYVAIPEPELARVKNSVVATARDDLLKLSTEKSSGELPSGEYYSWLLPMLDTTPRGSTIRALSMMMECEWDGSEPERRFIEKNIAAAKKGALIERVFVAPANVMLKAIDEYPGIKPHFEEEEPENLRGFFVDHSYLEKSDAALLAKLGDGFIDLDGRVALIDLHSKDGSARGEVTMKAASLSKLKDIHEQLLVHATRLNESLADRLRQGSAGLAGAAGSVDTL